MSVFYSGNFLPAVPPLVPNAVVAKAIYDATGDESMRILLGLSWNEDLVGKMNNVYKLDLASGMSDSDILLDIVTSLKVAPNTAQAYMNTVKAGISKTAPSNIITTTGNALTKVVEGAGDVAANANSTINTALIVAGVIGASLLVFQFKTERK